MRTALKVFVLLFLLVSCEGIKFVEYRYPIYVYNNSNHNIGCYFAEGGKYGTYYPDSLPKSDHFIIKNILSNHSYCLSNGIEWEIVFSTIPSDTLSIYIFNSDTLNKYSWDKIRKEEMFLRRYDLSLEDLKKLKYKVSYPPTPVMSDIKMYPPYK